MVKIAKKRTVYILLAAMVLTLVSPMGTTIQSAGKKNARIKKIVLNHSKYKLKKGKKLKLKVSFKPKKAKKKKILWKSSNKKIATVSQKGVVKARKLGKAKITAKVKGTKKKAVCRIQVVKAGTKTESDDTDTDDSKLSEPTAAPTAGHIVTPPSESGAAPSAAGGTPNPASPTPRYERPAETAPVVNRIDLTAENACYCEPPDGASVVGNADGSITVTFSKQDAALNVFLPDNAQMYYSDYKSVAITYTSSGGDLSYSLYDAEMIGADDTTVGRHPGAGDGILESETEKTLIFAVSDDCAGGCIRGLQIFNPNPLSDGQTITITIKSIVFCEKKDPTPEDLNPAETMGPGPSATAEVSAEPTATLPPAETVSPIEPTLLPATESPALPTKPAVKTESPVLPTKPVAKTESPVLPTKPVATTKPSEVQSAKPAATTAPGSAATTAPGSAATTAPAFPQTTKPAPTSQSTDKLPPTATPFVPLESPKYERPEETAPPVNPVDLTAAGAIHNESPNGASIVTNADAVTVTFTKQYAALNFYLPDNAQMYYSNYKSVVLTYTSQGGDLGHALYDVEMAGTSDSNAGKHPDWGKKIVESETEKTLIFQVTDQCVGNCIRGFQIFNPNEMSEGQTITITIKSLVFCDKENPTAEDLKPAGTATPLPSPTSTPIPIVTREPGEYGISSPAAEGDQITWDRVRFGSYYQSMYEPAQVPANPAEGMTYTDSDGTEMIYTAGKYYKKEPILWRVLAAEGDDALLIADQNLDSLPYHSENGSSMTWADSSVRQWLNETFYAAAFTENEKGTIRKTIVPAEPNPQAGTENGGETSDNIYLLSLNEATNKDYGFAIHLDNASETRRAQNTAYARARGAWTSDSGDDADNGWWWLRSQGSFVFDAAYVGSDGYADQTGFLAVNTGGGIRPALHINLKSVSWTKADTVSTKSVTDLQPSPVPTEDPVKQVDLSGVHIDAACGYYDDNEEKVYVNDTQTGNGDTTFMYFPIPVTVAPGEKIRVTIAGPKWGTEDFRLWTTPQGSEGAGDYVTDSNVFLRPTINADGSFKGTVELTAKDDNNSDKKVCSRITLKATWNVKVKDLVISEITVEKLGSSS